MCRDNWLKIVMVEFSMMFLAVTLHGIMNQEAAKTDIHINVNIQEPVVYVVHRDYEEKPTVTIEPKPTPEITIRTLTQEDKEILLQIAMAEAEGETTEGKALVMAVVLNRMSSNEFPDSVEDVVFQEGQFSVMGEGGRYYTTTPNEDCYATLQLIESGWDESNGAMYFESGDADGWHSRNLEYLFTQGGHRFYK